MKCGIVELHISGLFALVHLPHVLRAERLRSSAAGSPERALVLLRSLRLHRVCLNKDIDYTTGQIGRCMQNFCASLRVRVRDGADAPALKEVVLDCCYNVNEVTAFALRSTLDDIGCRYTLGTRLRGPVMRTWEWETLAPANL